MFFKDSFELLSSGTCREEGACPFFEPCTDCVESEAMFVNTLASQRLSNLILLFYSETGGLFQGSGGQNFDHQFAIFTAGADIGDR